MNVFISPFKNPFINLALEDHFLRQSGELPILFLYTNRPSVIMGRFQNPWLECHLPFLVKNDIWLVRRQSGGGCVYHDDGNLNFSFIFSGPLVDRNKYAVVLKDAFKKAEIDLEISPRHDLWLDGKKISGSAFKQTKDGSFHHGTFLVNSDMDKLEESLKQAVFPKNSKSIPSVRSKVISLAQKFPEAKIEDVVEIITHHLNSPAEPLEASILSLPSVQESFRKLNSWKWIFGETPAFDVETIEGVKTIHKGMIKEKVEREFNTENMKSLLAAEDLLKYFPDFSEQHSSSSLIY